MYAVRYQYPGAPVPVHEVLADVYAIEDSATSEDMQELHAAVLRANPDVETLHGALTDDLDSEIWIFVPPTRFKFRLPPSMGTRRDAYESEGVTDIDVMARVSAAVLQERVHPISLAQVEQDQAVARLMTVFGVGPFAAVALVGGDVLTPTQLAEADPAAIRTVLNQPNVVWPESINSMLPPPWTVLQARARRVMVSNRVPENRFPVPVAPAQVRKWHDEWRVRATTPQRTDAERRSAEAIADGYALLTDWLRANQHMQQGRADRAVDQYQQLFQRLGSLALKYNDVDASPSGPPIDQQIALIETMLKAIDLDDVDDMLEVTGRDLLRRSRPWSALSGFRGSHLLPPVDPPSEHGVDAVVEALHSADMPVHALGRRTARAYDGAWTSRTVGAATTSAATGLGTPNADARMRDLGTTDQEQLRQNTRAESFAAIKEGAYGGDAITIVTSEGLHLHRTPAFATEDSIGANIKADVLGTLPEELLSELNGVRDRFVLLNFDRVPPLRVRGLPLEAGFAAAYETLLEDVAALEDTAGVLWMDAEIATDPSAFLAALPLIMALQVPAALADAHEILGNVQLADGFGGITLSTATLETLKTKPMDQWPSVGLTLDPSNLASLPIGIALVRLQRLLRQANKAYREERHDVAAGRYRKLLDSATTNSALAELIADLERGFEFVSLEVEAQVNAGVPVKPSDFGDLFVESSSEGVYRPLLPGFVAPLRRAELRSRAAEVLVGQTAGDVIAAMPWTVAWDPDQQEVLDGDPDTTPGRPARLGRGKEVISLSDRVIEAKLVVMEAFGRLQQLTAGLNWLGYDPASVPVWQFDSLLSLAQRYADRADGLQQRALSFTERAESTELELMVAAHQVAVTEIEAERAAVLEEVAYLQLDMARQSLNNLREDRVWAWVSIIGQGLQLVGSVAGGAASQGVSTSEGVSSAQGAAGQSFSAARTIHELNQQIALANLSVATNYAALESARLQGLVADVRLQNARDMLEARQSSQFSPDFYYALARAVETMADRSLDLANRLGWLAERAYSFESRRVVSFVRQSYRQEGVDRFLSAARLQTDLESLSYERVAGVTQPQQVIKSTFSVREFYPAAILALQGGADTIPLSLSQEELDDRFPGLYLHRLRRLEIEFDGSLPAEGITAILQVNAGARVRVPNTPAYVAPDEAALDWPFDDLEESSYVLGARLTQSVVAVYSDYRAARDGGFLRQAPGTLDPLENLPPVGSWILHLPRSNQLFRPDQIHDIRVTVYFTAEFDPELARTMVERRTSELGAVRRYGVLVSGAAGDALSLKAFRDASADTSRPDVRLFRVEVAASDLKANLPGYHLENATGWLLGAGEGLTVRVACTAYPFGVRAEVTAGQVFSALHEVDVEQEGEFGFSYPARTNGPLDALATAIWPDPESALGTWVIKACDGAANSAYRANDDLGDPAEYAGYALHFNGGTGVVTRTLDAWVHARAVCQCSNLADGSVTLMLRAGSASPVGLTLKRVVGGGSEVLRVSLASGAEEEIVTSPELEVLGGMDEVYELTLEVVGTRAVGYLDGVSIVELDGLTPAPGGVALSSDADGVVHALDVDRLRYDGSTLTRAVEERWSNLDEWTAEDAEIVPTTRYRLDLSGLQDVRLHLEYTDRVAIPVWLTAPVIWGENWKGGTLNRSDGVCVNADPSYEWTVDSDGTADSSASWTVSEAVGTEIGLLAVGSNVFGESEAEVVPREVVPVRGVKRPGYAGKYPVQDASVSSIPATGAIYAWLSGDGLGSTRDRAVCGLWWRKGTSTTRNGVMLFVDLTTTPPRATAQTWSNSFTPVSYIGPELPGLLDSGDRYFLGVEWDASNVTLYAWKAGDSTIASEVHSLSSAFNHSHSDVLRSCFAHYFDNTSFDNYTKGTMEVSFHASSLPGATAREDAAEAGTLDAIVAHGSTVAALRPVTSAAEGDTTATFRDSTWELRDSESPYSGSANHMTAGGLNDSIPEPE